MDMEQFERIGEDLRHLGHKRHELVDRIAERLQSGKEQESMLLFRELSDVSEQAIHLMQKQKQLLDKTISRA